MSLHFDLTLHEVPFTVTGKDGKETSYVLREMDGTGRAAYQSEGMLRDARGAVVFGDDGEPVPLVDGLQDRLLARSLFDTAGEPVPVAVFSAWPARVLTALFAEALKVNRMGGEVEGNGPEASGANGSDSPAT